MHIHHFAWQQQHYGNYAGRYSKIWKKIYELYGTKYDWLAETEIQNRNIKETISELVNTTINHRQWYRCHLWCFWFWSLSVFKSRQLCRTDNFIFQCYLQCLFSCSQALRLTWIVQVYLWFKFISSNKAKWQCHFIVVSPSQILSFLKWTSFLSKSELHKSQGKLNSLISRGTYTTEKTSMINWYFLQSCSDN